MKFTDLDQALHAAIEAAQEIVADKLLNDQLLDSSRFEISDETGVVVLIVPFRGPANLSSQFSGSKRRICSYQ